MSHYLLTIDNHVVLNDRCTVPAYSMIPCGNSIKLSTQCTGVCHYSTNRLKWLLLKIYEEILFSQDKYSEDICRQSFNIKNNNIWFIQHTCSVAIDQGNSHLLVWHSLTIPKTSSTP